jgi:NADH-quinone oxidoreductase subunit L
MVLLEEHPGLWYVLATLLPLASFVVLLLVGGVRCFLRGNRTSAGDAIYQLLGGDNPRKLPAYIATAAIGLAFLCSLAGFVTFADEAHHLEKEIRALKNEEATLHHELDHADDAEEEASNRAKLNKVEKELAEKEGRWNGHLDWARVVPAQLNPPKASEQEHHPDKNHATVLRVGYHIDYLSAVMFLMVSFIATLIHIFSIGYMSDELAQKVEDHQVHVGHHHLVRRGRFGRFFLFMSLFCFSMLNLILADNLFQVFLSWELVGLCSYLLIGFYFERTSASNAANKAFITNRIGDAGFILGLLILWTYVGTLNFQEIFARVRSPDEAMSTKPEQHGKKVHLEYASRIVHGQPIEVDSQRGTTTLRVSAPDDPVDLNTRAILFPRDQHGHFYGVGPRGKKEVKTYDRPGEDDYSSMPYWLLVAAGLGIFLGCVGKSAQFPLHVWLPDAMEGPTPVSALIHAATMVAAGVYLVGRAFPLFTPEAQLVIAYTGAITLVVAATTAVVMTDIKKVLAYSTVSQLGYMMLALGVGGWVVGLFHLITHAFFKALLFLCSGSVIYGCHHEQDMEKMGGLYPKMKVTALTMLIGVLAISGIPLFSGWYSKDGILAQAYGFALVRNHFLLFLLPLVTAGLTAFYMFRLWLMTFAGKPRDEHLYECAHESPWVMTAPLIVLAFFSVVVAWGWPMWDAEASVLEHTIHHSMPTSVMADYGMVSLVDQPPGEPLTWYPGKVQSEATNTRLQAHQNHAFVGNLALGLVLIGITFAFLLYYLGALDPVEAKEQFPGVHRFLWHKWYFDELYSALLVRPALAVAGWFRSFDTKVIDGTVDGTARAAVKLSWGSGRFDFGIVDGLVNLTARVFYATGAWLRNVQTGYLRSYVLFLVVAAVGIWVILVYLVGAAVPPAAGGP